MSDDSVKGLVRVVDFRHIFPADAPLVLKYRDADGKCRQKSGHLALLKHFTGHLRNRDVEQAVLHHLLLAADKALHRNRLSFAGQHAVLNAYNHLLADLLVQNPTDGFAVLGVNQSKITVIPAAAHANAEKLLHARIAVHNRIAVIVTHGTGPKYTCLA